MAKRALIFGEPFGETMKTMGTVLFVLPGEVETVVVQRSKKHG